MTIYSRYELNSHKPLSPLLEERLQSDKTPIRNPALEKAAAESHQSRFALLTLMEEPMKMHSSKGASDTWVKGPRAQADNLRQALDYFSRFAFEHPRVRLAVNE